MQNERRIMYVTQRKGRIKILWNVAGRLKGGNLINLDLACLFLLLYITKLDTPGSFNEYLAIQILHVVV